MMDLSAAPVDRRLSRLLRLMPDACMRIQRGQCVLYSAHGGGRVFRTENPSVALWIMGFTKPRSAWQVLHECPAHERQSVYELLMKLCELHVLVEGDGVPDAVPEAEHRASIPVMGALTESVYALASDLRGLGPAAHEGLRDQAELSLQHRLESLLANIDSLRADLAQLRAPLVERQLSELHVHPGDCDLQLHIGSGGFDLPGWINIDSHPAPLAINLDWGLPFRPASARFVFLSHLLEAHKFGYDFETLQRCLLRAGFVNVRRCDYQGSPFEALRVDHASLNAVAANGERHYSLFVEAQAPEA